MKTPFKITPTLMIHVLSEHRFPESFAARACALTWSLINTSEMDIATANVYPQPNKVKVKVYMNNDFALTSFGEAAIRLISKTFSNAHIMIDDTHVYDCMYIAIDLPDVEHNYGVPANVANIRRTAEEVMLGKFDSNSVPVMAIIKTPLAATEKSDGGTGSSKTEEHMIDVLDLDKSYSEEEIRPMVLLNTMPNEAWEIISKFSRAESKEEADAARREFNDKYEGAELRPLLLDHIDLTTPISCRYTKREHVRTVSEVELGTLAFWLRDEDGNEGEGIHVVNDTFFATDEQVKKLTSKS